ncbi:neural/ectodermal development factor IMP-L2-like [Leptidea sinapis]|uniref:neural/ectodermal development factor IMP-L2-like n=1 Tax=Leptidea sinapis TaxID=189913 RepID=UPI00212FD3F6|nr:neural/ectodermal development factor IMP-L2-like [Leptidea sinapis]XP_050680242.1 neural/ectodermal development factor IMP-L2-like [Leptidea sinapis]
MSNIVLLLTATALVTLEVALQANAQISHSKFIDTNIKRSNSPRWRARVVSKYVNIFEAPPETATHVSGRPTVLKCVAGGNPAPVIKWMKNGVIVADLEGVTNEIFSVHPSSIGRMTSKLVIEAPDNGDVFTCVATSGTNVQTTSTTVFTDAQQELYLASTNQAPIITAYYDEIMQAMGTTITLPCRVHSTTTAEVYWVDQNDQVVYGNKRLQVLPSGDLRIPELVFSDMGGYTCVAENMFGKDSFNTFLYPYSR